MLDVNGVDITAVQEDSSIRTAVGAALCLDNHDRRILTFNESIEMSEEALFTEGMLANVRHIHVGSYFLTQNRYISMEAFVDIENMNGREDSFSMDFGVTAEVDGVKLISCTRCAMMWPPATEKVKMRQ